MGDTPKDFQIRIVTSADLAAAKASAQELGNISTAAKASAATQVEAGKEVAAVEAEAFTSKQQLKQAVKGLKDEFPMLAHIARLSINPITAAVALATAAWALWKSRVEEATKALGGVELPEVSEKMVGQVSAMAQAYSDFAEALRKTVEAYNSVDAASKRADERQDKQAERNKKLLESQKNLALAKLEADKSKLKPGEYEQAKGEIEDFFEGLGVKDTEAQKMAKLQRKAQKEDHLARDAQAKLDQAAGIKVGTEVQDSKLEAKLKLLADAAEGNIKERQQRIVDFKEYQTGEGSILKRMGTAFKINYDLGRSLATLVAQGDPRINEAIATQQGVIDSQQPMIGRYEAFMGNKEGRKLARNQRGELISEAGKEAGEAETIHRDMWDQGGELDQFDADKANSGAVARNNTLAGANKAAGAVNDQAKQVTEEITRSVESGSKILESVTVKLVQLHAAQKAAEDRIKSLEATRKLNPPGT